MIAQDHDKTQVLLEPSARRKLAQLDGALTGLLHGQTLTVPSVPGRDVQILQLRDLPDKKGLASVEGQARLLHDLASIELQAMELGLRTLQEFPEADGLFRHELAQVTYEEGQHLKLCLDGLEELGFKWGSFPTHLGLWNCVRASDSLLDRLLIVHRFLEGSGLDASTHLLRRLSGVRAPAVVKAVATIAREEVQHVQFGSRWYHRFVIETGADPERDFAERLKRLIARVPRRLEPINPALRREAGFLDGEIQTLEELRRASMHGSKTLAFT